MNQSILDDVVIVRGGGDLATGVIQKFYRAGIKVLVLEIEKPMAIRRTVSLCCAVTNGTSKVEDMTARRIADTAECESIWSADEIPILVDPDGKSIAALKPNGVVDAILAKRNCGTAPDMAPVVIALGPGFSAPQDAHAVIETMRGHTLGRLIFDGGPMPNTGIPGVVAGHAGDRVLRAPCDGNIENLRNIGDIIKKGDALFRVKDMTVTATLDGVLRGLIENGMYVTEGLKSADIDPRQDTDCRTITDKARCLGGAALEAYLYLRRKLAPVSQA